MQHVQDTHTEPGAADPPAHAKAALHCTRKTIEQT